MSILCINKLLLITAINVNYLHQQSSTTYIGATMDNTSIQQERHTVKPLI